jgi:outer membrane cobalamin receptor
MKRGSKRAAALAALGLMACAASAQTEELSLEALLRQEVQGPSRYAQSLLDAPAAVSVLGQHESALLGHVTVADMLARLPGVYLGSTRSYSTVGMRGFSRPGDYNARLLMAIDGFRVNDAVFDQALPEFEFPLMADWVKRVELVYGPGSSIYGGNALFGVVNLVTLDGADAPGWRLKGSTGSFGERRAMLQYGNGSLGGGDLFAGINLQSSRGEDLELPELGLPGARVAGLDGLSYSSAFVKYRLGNWRVSGASMLRSKSVATAPYDTLAGAAGTRFRDHYLYGEIAYDEAWQSEWRRSLRLSLARTGFNGRYVYEGEPALINRDEAMARWATLEGRLHWRGWLNHELMMGAEARVTPHAQQLNYDQAPYRLLLNSHESARTFGVFAQDLWQISEHWQLTTGLRVDSVEHWGAQASPRLAMVYRPQPHESIKLMAGRAFRPANLTERFYSDGGVSQLANPQLAPEKLGTVELAWERALAQDLTLSFNAYATGLSDMIEFVPLQGEDGVGRYENLSRVRTRGLDLGLEQRRASGWQWRANLSLADARQQGQRLSNSPRWLFKGHLIAPLAPDWTLATEWQAMDARLGRSRVDAVASANAVLRFTGWRGPGHRAARAEPGRQRRLRSGAARDGVDAPAASRPLLAPGLAVQLLRPA